MPATTIAFYGQNGQKDVCFRFRVSSFMFLVSSGSFRIAEIQRSNLKLETPLSNDHVGSLCGTG